MLYFASDWIILYLDDYSVLDDIANEAFSLGCSMVWLSKRDNDGQYFILDLAISVASSEILDAFTRAINEKITLTEWLPIPEEIFITGRDLNVRELMSIAFITPDFIEYLSERAMRNEAIMDKKRFDTRIYHSFSWIAEDPISNDIIAPINRAIELGYSVFFWGFGEAKNKLITLKVALLMPSQAAFDTLSSELWKVAYEIHPLQEQELYKRSFIFINILGKDWHQKMSVGMLPLIAKRNSEILSNDSLI